MKNYRVGKNTFKAEMNIECNRKQALVAFSKLKHLVVKFMSVKENNIVNMVIIYNEQFCKEIKKIETIKELFSLEKKISNLVQ